MHLEPKVISLLNHRGIRSEEDISEFLSDHPRKTYDPFLLLNMEAGVDLLLSAVSSGKKICIYGDYDADGITSIVILTEVLSLLTPPDLLMHYQPSRFREGYGLNREAVRKVYEEGCRMLVTVDCGIVSKEEVAYARSLGMDVLVTDHHNVVPELRPDCPVINPHQPECHYPFPDLAGCGVAYKLAQAIVRKTGIRHSILTELLDIVAIGTVADIVPLRDENRTLVKYGLQVINGGYRENLRVLIEAIGLKPGRIRSENIAFGIAPHLNAAGRMEHAGIATEQLLTKDPDVLRERTRELVECNTRRKEVQETIYQEAASQVETDLAEDPFLVIRLDGAHEGVTGIACGKIEETYYRPSVIVTELSAEKAKGTGRSIEGVDLYELLSRERPLFQTFGGHAAACGFTMKPGDIDTLRKDLNEACTELRERDPDLFVRKLHWDISLDAGEINEKLVRELQLLEPCGEGNPSPVIAASGYIRRFGRMGSENQYVRFRLLLDDGRELNCVAFRNPEEVAEQAEACGDRRVLVIGALGINVFRGRSELQLRVSAIREA
ncbi:MAG: single-stranded-DNA-specific exonuclease RecJ [Anaerovoracaceae bacterium]|jgi:single-stranded-DNA-specific exonuclease